MHDPIAWQLDPQVSVPLGQAQTPLLVHVPPLGAEHDPDARGAALQAVSVPRHTTVPDCWHPPVPAEVQLAPVARHHPLQLLCPAGHTQAPDPSH